jgi:hypothetical protein
MRKVVIKTERMLDGFASKPPASMRLPTEEENKCILENKLKKILQSKDENLASTQHSALCSD